MALSFLLHVLTMMKTNRLPPKKKLASITSSQDATSNTMTFNYDNAGKWISGVNRFDQNYTVSYNNQGNVNLYSIENQFSEIGYEYSPGSGVLLNGI